jgi:hypothetical protein
VESGKVDSAERVENIMRWPENEALTRNRDTDNIFELLAFTVTRSLSTLSSIFSEHLIILLADFLINSPIYISTEASNTNFDALIPLILLVKNPLTISAKLLFWIHVV